MNSIHFLPTTQLKYIYIYLNVTIPLRTQLPVQSLKKSANIKKQSTVKSLSYVPLKFQPLKKEMEKGDAATPATREGIQIT